MLVMALAVVLASRLPSSQNQGTRQRNTSEELGYGRQVSAHSFKPDRHHKNSFGKPSRMYTFKYHERKHVPGRKFSRSVPQAVKWRELLYERGDS